MAKILQELLALKEAAAAAPIELEKIGAMLKTKGPESIEFVKHLTNKHWGSTRLTWHGDTFFSKDDLGPAYQKTIDNAMDLVNDHPITISFDPVEFTIKAKDGQEEQVEVEIEAESKIESAQECYLAYDPVTDALIVGFDAWLDTSVVEEDFDSQFEKQTGVEFDYEVYHNDYNKFHQQLIKMNMTGVACVIKYNHGAYTANFLFEPDAGSSFYSSRNGNSVRNMVKAQFPKLVELRLD